MLETSSSSVSSVRWQDLHSYSVRSVPLMIYLSLHLTDADIFSTSLILEFEPIMTNCCTSISNSNLSDLNIEFWELYPFIQDENWPEYLLSFNLIERVSALARFLIVFFLIKIILLFSIIFDSYIAEILLKSGLLLIVQQILLKNKDN